jgi:hypothetical protein
MTRIQDTGTLRPLKDPYNRAREKKKNTKLPNRKRLNIAKRQYHPSSIISGEWYICPKAFLIGDGAGDHPNLWFSPARRCCRFGQFGSLCGKLHHREGTS